MKPEALDALTSQTMRPAALDAFAETKNIKKQEQDEAVLSGEGQVCS